MQLDVTSLIPEVQQKLYTQDYGRKDHIKDIQIIELKNNVGEEGDLSEIFRLDDQSKLELIPDFQLKQINRTRVFQNSIKAWHIHFNQDEIWYVLPSFHLVVGLWDLRQDSPTSGQSEKIVLGGGNSRILYIPRGVAHGSVNYSNQPTELFYFINQLFDVNQPDEKRIPWDSLGESFWKPERD
jgi:dTDP-4-dehydrorhamnose 3,5-epimerase